MSNGIPVDIIYREVDRFGRYIDTVIKGGKAFNGYTTAFWHNIKNSKVLFDKTALSQNSEIWRRLIFLKISAVRLSKTTATF